MNSPRPEWPGNQSSGATGQRGNNEKQQRFRIRLEVEGKPYEGNYWVAGKILVVSTSKGGASTQLAEHQPEALARKLLLKLASENKA